LAAIFKRSPDVAPCMKAGCQNRVVYAGRRLESQHNPIGWRKRNGSVTKILTVVGARPQFIKAAPVSRALAAEGLCEILVHTGQHFDATMSAIFFEELDIPAPAYSLEVNSLGHGAMTGRMLEKLEETILAEKPDLVLVYGDTNSTMAGALAAAKLHIPVAHVEAGLRSFNRQMPEEINRVVADHLSTFLFCPTQTAVRNLAAEGITTGVHAVGDVMYDMTLAATTRAERQSTILETLGLLPRSYAVSTIHRAENTDNLDRFGKIKAWLENAAQQIPIVMPLHPRTRKLMKGGTQVPAGVRLIEPLGYLDMTRLVHHAAAVFTDSGGLQKEAYFHRVPCVTLRDETEWVETIEAGWNRLWTTSDYMTRRDILDYGSGNSASIIAARIKVGF
jgi:UDP-GlcNAc3NAcA epimerase